MRMGAPFASILLVYCICSITFVPVTRGDACATTDELMAPLYQQIDADMGYWRNFLNGSQLTRNELKLLVSRNREYLGLGRRGRSVPGAASWLGCLGTHPYHKRPGSRC